jgi:hypothetical protein
VEEPGLEGLKKWFRQSVSNLADKVDIHVTIDDTFGEGDKLVTRCTSTFTDKTTGKKMTQWSIFSALSHLDDLVRTNSSALIRPRQSRNDVFLAWLPQHVRVVVRADHRPTAVFVRVLHHRTIQHNFEGRSFGKELHI